jgi:multiple RNA-binding domain-containing protein 1
VRLPKKYDQRSHRGFAFVEFLTKQEAANAYSHLEKTHLYGRHLVLEWAEDDESIDALRQKTRKHFNSAEGPVGQQKKIKIDIDEAIEGLAQATQHDD